MTKLWKRLFLCVNLLCFSGLFVAPNADVSLEEAIVLRIGVREDARPFSYKLDPSEQSVAMGTLLRGELGNAGYGGYVVQICDHVLSKLAALSDASRLTIEVQPVNAENRFRLLRAPSGEFLQSDKLLEERPIDILCDPSTVDSGRLHDLNASLPIYVSGITFATTRDFFPRSGSPCAHILGVVSETTSASTGVRTLLEAGNFPRFRSELIEFLYEKPEETPQGKCQSKRGEEKEASENKQDAIRQFSTHTELSEAFCKGDVIYYVGDREIIRRSLERQPDCSFSDASITHADERYAIFARSILDPADPKNYYILKFFEILSRDVQGPNSVLNAAFSTTFPGYPLQEKLKALYWSISGSLPD